MSVDDEGRALRDAAAVEPRGPGRYGVEVSARYTIPGGYPNGGYLQCIMASGALAAASAEGSNHLHATSVTTNYIGAPTPGPAELEVDVRRVGRGVSFVHAALAQAGQIVTESLITLGTLHEDSVPRYMDAQPPQLAPVDECIRARPGDEIAMGGVLDGSRRPVDRRDVDERRGEGMVAPRRRRRSVGRVEPPAGVGRHGPGYVPPRLVGVGTDLATDLLRPAHPHQRVVASASVVRRDRRRAG
jgi:acyl-coenzyme A thioesterase PaaI-like protein